MSTESTLESDEDAHEMSMAKFELVEELAARFPQLLLRDADIAVKTIFDAMSDALADGRRIEIHGFGGFGLNRHPPQVGRSPKSGGRVLVPKKRVPHFKAGKELRGRVGRSLERQDEPSSEGESAVSFAAVKADRQADSNRQTAGFPVDGSVSLAMSC